MPGKADRIVAKLSRRELVAALNGHRRIGDAPDSTTSALEQAAAASTDANVIPALSRGDRTYETKFGHVYLVCASGQTATQLLAILMERLYNDAKTEWRVTRSELATSNRIRIDRTLGVTT